MLRARLVPCLLVKNGGLVKTTRFTDPKYVGDPINAVRIFNEKEADELIVLDIDATVQRCEPNYSLIRKLARECQMPLCYGGGVCSVDQFERIVGLGVEKVAVSSAAVERLSLVEEAAKVVGSQSVVVVIDAKKKRLSNRYEVVTHNGSRSTKLDVGKFASDVAACGAGEVVVNSVDRDGSMKGYDHDLISGIKEGISIPLTALGGAGSLDDVRLLIDKIGLVGAGAGSLFVFKGKYKAVLINYPTLEAKENSLGLEFSFLD